MELTLAGFEARYSVRVLAEAPNGEVLEFRRPRQVVAAGQIALDTGAELLWLEVEPSDGEPWIGEFECGPGGLTALLATPAPDVVCVVARGQGYWVPVSAAAEFEIVRALPVLEFFSFPVSGRLVFMDFTAFAGYGCDGLSWQTDRLSWDGLKVTEVSPLSIAGLAWDSPAGRDVSFSVDVESGRSEGGSSPARYGLR